MKIDKDFYKNLLDSLYDGIYYVDCDRRITYWNKAAERITGYTSSEVLGRLCSDNILVHVNGEGVDLCKGLCIVSRTIADGRIREAEMYLLHKDGHRFPVSVRVIPIRDSNDKIIGAVEIFSDNSPKVTIRQRIEDLEKMTLLEPLTMLVNKKYVEMNLHARLDEMCRYGWPFGVLYITVDDFKKINDVYGYNVGNKILKMVARTLLFNSRTSDVIGRWSGEDFISIIVNANEERLHSTANRARLLVEKSGYPKGADIVRVTISIGATLALQIDTMDTLLKRAEQLMYHSRNSGGNRVSMKLEV